MTPIDLRRPKLIGSFEKSRGGKIESFGSNKVRQCCGFVAQVGPRSVDIFELWTVERPESQSLFFEIKQKFARQFERRLNSDVTNKLLQCRFNARKKKRQEKHFIYKNKVVSVSSLHRQLRQTANRQPPSQSALGALASPKNFLLFG